MFNFALSAYIIYSSTPFHELLHRLACIRDGYLVSPQYTGICY